MKYYTDKLDKSQIKFIQNKVKALGSIKEVNNFYYKDCTVDKYARWLAKKLFTKRISIKRGK